MNDTHYTRSGVIHVSQCLTFSINRFKGPSIPRIMTLSLITRMYDAISCAKITILPSIKVINYDK